MQRWLVRGIVALALLAVLIQVVPAGRTNPPATAPVTAPPEIVAILRRSCFDCHSNETRWPWYAYVAPVSWLVVHDVEEGREHMNFSVWGEYIEKKRLSAASDIDEQLEKGSMPLPNYLLLHPEARLSPAEVEALRSWADGVE